MIDVPTLFILGAGASVPYGYPTGASLRKTIIEDFHNAFERMIKEDSSIRAKEQGQELKRMRVFVDRFEKSKIDSIDKFLSLNPTFQYHGKIAITWAILRAEMYSQFAENMETSFQDQDWYKYLFNRMIDLCKKPEDACLFKGNRISFITFNYDRSLDFFLYESFLNSFHEYWKEIEGSKSPIDQIDYLKESIPFSIIHVYGQVDNIQWHGGTPYRSGYNLKILKELSSNIRIIGERTRDTPRAIMEHMANAQRTFFLGFGYADENLESIRFLNLMHRELHIYGTALGMTDQEINIVKGKFIQKMEERKLPRAEPSLRKWNCYDLLREYL